jgi:hypothetical protein
LGKPQYVPTEFFKKMTHTAGTKGEISSSFPAFARPRTFGSIRRPSTSAETRYFIVVKALTVDPGG